MKILCVSLLRIGDVFLSAPAIAGLRRLYPQAEVHFLINRDAIAAQQVMDGVDRWHVFERTHLQSLLADAEEPLLKPFFQLSEQLRQLHSEKFNLILNLTHNRLSGWICGAIGQEQTLGLSLNSQTPARFGSSWFQYLNKEAENRGQDTFHYADIFSFGVGLDSVVKHWNWKVAPQMAQQAKAILGSALDPIFIQPFSSEKKKEWSSSSWAEALKEVQTTSRNPIFVLAAPNESEKAEQWTSELEKAGVQTQLCVCRLDLAVALLERARVLITLDTSIKHLAAPLKTEVVELSLGSSDWRRTGIYKEGAYIIQGAASCAPCPHSLDCSAASHLCGESLNPKAVALVVGAILKGDEKSLPSRLRDLNDSTQVWKTGFAGSEFWQCQRVTENTQANHFKVCLDKLTTKFIFQGEHTEALGRYGTASYQMNEWIQKQYPNFKKQDWLKLLRELDQEVDVHHELAQDAKRRLDQMLNLSRGREMVELSEMRRIQCKIEETRQRIDVRQKLIRSLEQTAEVKV